MGDLARVLRAWPRLMWRHWPALLALTCLGVGIRSGVLWLAVHVSSDHHILGQLLLILGPPGLLVPLVVAFYVCRVSLPRLDELNRLRAENLPTEGRPTRLIDIAASVLIPYMVLYESYGLLDEDIGRFRNTAAFSEFTKGLGGQHIDYGGRLGIYGPSAAVGIVVGAWVVRWVIGTVERLLGFLFLAYVGAMADVFYTAQLAGQTLVLRTQGAQWVRGRNAAHWVSSTYHWLENELGFLAGPFRIVVEFVSAVSTSWNEIILVPIAWLGVGAVVLARKEADEEDEARADEAGRHTDRPPRRPPLPIRLVLSLVTDVRKRVGALWSALKLLATAGLIPMLVFSLIVLVVVRIPAQLTPLVHVLVGPTTTSSYLAFAPILDSLELALSLFLTLPLVAAAVEWLESRRLEQEGLTADLDRRTGPTTGAGQGTASST